MIVAFGTLNLCGEEYAGRLGSELDRISLVISDESRLRRIFDFSGSGEQIRNDLVPGSVLVEPIGQPAFERFVVQECQFRGQDPVADRVTPVVGPVFSEVITGQQAIDFQPALLGRRFRQKGIQLRWGRLTADEIEADPAKKLFVGNLSEGILVIEFLDDQGIQLRRSDSQVGRLNRFDRFSPPTVCCRNENRHNREEHADSHRR